MRAWLFLTGLAALLAGALVLPGLVVEQDAAATDATDRSCQDDDHDGFGRGCERGPDCNDLDAKIHPGRAEVCNLRDDDCNGLVDDATGCKATPLGSARVNVPRGSFTMGSTDPEAAPDEAPVHRVALAGFAIDRYEVTNRRYQACVEAGRCKPPALASSAKRQEYFGNPRFGDYPVVFVDWKQARDFCSWAGGRLPTEAEWEKAARGGDAALRKYPWGNAAPDCSRANMGGAGSCVGDTDRVGRRPAGASPYGAQDMAGNVWEWVADWYNAAYYRRSPARDPRGPAAGTLKVMRGGCWVSGASSLRVSCRKAELPASWAPNVGFRCAYGRR